MKDKTEDPTKIELSCGTQKIEIVDLCNIEKDLNNQEEGGKNREYYELLLFFKYIIEEHIPKH